MALIDPVDYDAIRGAILSSLDSDNCPDALIELPIYKDRAIAIIEAQAPDPAYPDTDLNKRNAAIFLCAAFLIPALTPTRLIQDSDDLGGNFTLDKVNWKERTAQLMAQADSAMNALLGIDYIANTQGTHLVLAQLTR